jgi:hypothetical protein
MKTTVEIPDPLFKQARQFAEREGITLKVLIEQGLRAVLAAKPDAKPFRLRRASFKGQGLRPEMQAAGWDAIRAAAYQGRDGSA